MATTHYKRLTLPRPNSLLSNFPVRVSISADADIGGRAQSDASDVRIKLPDGTSLDWQIEEWAIAAGNCDAELWVKVPTIPSASDTEIDVHYGGGAASPEHSTTLSIPNLIGWWHLNESGDGTADEYRDSSGNGYHGRGDPAMNRQTGAIGYGQFGTGGVERIIVDDFPAMFTEAAFTASMWVVGKRSGYGNYPTLQQSGSYGKIFYLGRGSYTNKARYSVKYQVTQMVYNGNHESFDDSWHHIAMRRADVSSLSGYSDGRLDGIDNTADTLGSYVDSQLQFSSMDDTDGGIDEIRVYIADKGADWLAYEHSQITSPGTWGAEQSSGNRRRRLLLAC